MTRGNKQKLFKERPILDIRKYSFTNRVVEHWNSLHDSVFAATSVRSFERRLDKFWGKSELVYDYTAHIATGYKFTNNEELELEADDSLLSEEGLW